MWVTCCGNREGNAEFSAGEAEVPANRRRILRGARLVRLRGWLAGVHGDPAADTRSQPALVPSTKANRSMKLSVVPECLARISSRPAASSSSLNEDSTDIHWVPTRSM